tara:strand:- start:352 stop:1191 length:840 start_codon:yes stop_codon:yes gene_type:complete
MKHAILLLILCTCLGASAQITLDETYANAGFSGGILSWQTLEVVRLELGGDKFVFRDNENKTLKFYNLDHSLWKSISYSGAIDVDPDYNSANILYISQHLFDLDDEIEFMYVDVGSDVGVTQVVNEDGAFLFTANDQAPRMNGSVPQNQQPIYNTSGGTFMILSGANSSDGNAYVYRLPGALQVGIEIGSIGQMNDGSSLLIYPNPTADEVRIDYALPQGEGSGVLIIYDSSGNEVKRLNIDRRVDHVNVLIGEFASGTYICNLQTVSGISTSSKLVVQ